MWSRGHTLEKSIFAQVDFYTRLPLGSGRSCCALKAEMGIVMIMAFQTPEPTFLVYYFMEVTLL
jgi:hypothetical protein